MILLSVGTQLPFDRLVRLVDEIAVEISEEIFGQIGNGYYLPKNFAYFRTLNPNEFEKKIIASRVLVSHAGIGSLLGAKRYQKPIIFFPRRAALGEHRNDHQLATCSQLNSCAGIYVAKDRHELSSHLSTENLVPVCDAVDQWSRLRLNQSIRDFITSL